MSVRATLEARPGGEQLIGEIVDRRFVLMEARGRTPTGFKFGAYDMESLTRVEILVMVNAEIGIKGYLLLSGQPSRPALTVAAAPPAQEVEALRLEAAWFAQGEQIDQGEDAMEDWDLPERQAVLEETARELTFDAILRYALGTA
jgi:hypothetical protein